ncbi:MAG: C45 family autoproteolytic acyltransferase/hydrolase [Candidatus Thorarchaeota archaeon]
MKEVKVSGSYFEMGEMFGKTLSPWLREFKPKEINLDFAVKCVDAIEQYAPDLLEELQGIAKGSGQSYEALQCAMMTPVYIFGCTLFAVSGEHTAGGSPIYARQHDWIMEDLVDLHAIHSNPESGHKSVGFSFGDFGRYGGMNEKGLTIASAYCTMYTGKIRPGVRMNISTRWALDKFSSTEEAAEYLAMIPHTEPVSFLVLDGSGTIARIEATPEKSQAEFIDEGFGSAINVFVMDDMKHLDKGLPERHHTNVYKRRLGDWFEENKGKITLEDVRRICSDPKQGICQTNEEYSVTIWSWIAETNPTSMRIAPGPPCDVDYKQMDFFHT